MALGNNCSMGQARGKNKPILAKRHKEITEARSFTPFPASDVAANVPNACALAPLPNTYYHDGSSALPVVHDFVFSRKRASQNFWLPSGVYKINDGGSFKTITVGSGRVAGIDNCK